MIQNQDSSKSNSDHQAHLLSLDALEFKPLTDGLGFHQEKRNNIPPRPFQKTVREAPTPQKRSTAPFTQTLSAPQPELAAFYGHTPAPMPASLPRTLEVSDPGPRLKKEIVEVVPASSKEKILALVVDAAVVSICVLGSLALFVLVAGLEIGPTFKLFQSAQMAPIVGIFFSLSFLLYFTAMDSSRNSTLGKELMGVRLAGTKGTEVSIVQAFAHAVLELLSLVTFFFPILMPFDKDYLKVEVIRSKAR